MLDVGFSEILLTSAIALVVLGPERLPKVARQVGNWMGRARAMARQLSEQLEREVSADELMKAQSKPVKSNAYPANSSAPPVAGPVATPLPAAVTPPEYLNPYADASTTTAAAMHPDAHDAGVAALPVNAPPINAPPIKAMPVDVLPADAQPIDPSALLGAATRPVRHVGPRPAEEPPAPDILPHE